MTVTILTALVVEDRMFLRVQDNLLILPKSNQICLNLNQAKSILFEAVVHVFFISIL